MTEEELKIQEELTTQNIEKRFANQDTGEAAVAVKKVDKIGLSFYGERFDGWQRVGELKDLILTFKEFYYAQKIIDPKKTALSIARMFNEDVVFPMERRFHPYSAQLKNWTKKWNKDIVLKNASTEPVDEHREVQQVIKTRREQVGNNVDYLIPDDMTLEAGTKTLAGELLNDALQFHRDTQDMEDEFETDELVKRKTYVINVFAHVTKMVHNKASLLLKASAEKRENTNFLMTLMKRATSGELTDEELVVLGDTAITQEPEQNT